MTLRQAGFELLLLTCRNAPFLKEVCEALFSADLGTATAATCCFIFIVLCFHAQATRFSNLTSCLGLNVLESRALGTSWTLEEGFQLMLAQVRN